MNSPSFVLLAAPQRDPQRSSPRLGITASRRVGPAVVRARAKRRIREWFRRHRDELPPRVDLVVIARAGAATGSARAVAAELSAGAARLRALRERS